MPVKLTEDNNLDSYKLFESSDIFDREVAHPDEIKACYRNFFFGITRLCSKSVFEYLEKEVFPLYSETNLIETLSPFNNCGYSWNDFEDFPESLPQDIKALVCKLSEWQQRFGLVETNEEKWILKWVINSVFDLWKTSPTARKQKLFREFQTDSYKYYFGVENQIKNQKICPPFNLPEYFPHLQKRKHYLEQLQNSINERIEDDNILKYAPNQNKTSFKISILEKFEKSLEPYFDKVEKIYRENQYKDVPLNTELARDLIWTVGVLFEDKSYSDLAEKGTQTLDPNLKNSRIKIFPESGVVKIRNNGKWEKLKESFIQIVEYKEYNRTTVLRAVTRILSTIGIKLNMKKGRRKGKKTNYSVKIRQKLGK